jgi:hypothetical protein
VRTRSFKPWR